MIEDNAIRIQKEIDEHRNELVLDFVTGEMVLLLGWTDQYEEDYYYVVATRTRDDRKFIRLHSCVCGFIWLKNVISDEDYERIKNVWFLNYPSLEATLEFVKMRKVNLK